jgi:hypothetical protein
VIVCVNIALASLPVNECGPCDPNVSGAVTVAEIIGAVNSGLNGC